MGNEVLDKLHVSQSQDEFNMIKKWKGSYKYDSQKAQALIGHPCTFFTIEMEIFENDTLKGIVTDDLKTGGMKGTGEVSGEIHRDLIYFEKKMPHNSVLDLKNGRREFPDKKHPVIIYEGELESKTRYKGTWSFEKKWAFLFGFIPIKYCPGKGTWEMELEN